ncbi:MAG TPA: serine O-acetyltransferase [Candidatus Borkfalkia avistercoris]|uniref:Serine acetyltransferase n=1 Tax=Candidatus Borkfalkia avistercoris TaxID=2838504 RepID=A0A9D2CYD8_9FIRM|nr:serine O-acetyltransferase [Candidatus Borkfalkia avistercoris]
MFKRLRADIEAAKRNDPAARNKFEIWLTYSGVHALSWHRFANRLYKMHLKLLARIVSQLAKFLTGIEIHPAAKIEGGVFIDHGTGVVIGETAEVKSGVVIYQGVTLGGTGKDKGKRHPTIEKDVVISSGAKVLGGFTVGEGAKIGAGAVVLKEVPPHATVVGVPARVVRIRGEKPDLLQEKVDPNAEEIRALKCRVHKLEAALEKLTGEKFECSKEEENLFPAVDTGAYGAPAAQDTGDRGEKGENRIGEEEKDNDHIEGTEK